MLETLPWSLLGVIAGACIAIQAPINAQLGQGLGLPIAAAATSFAVGTVVLVVATVVMAQVQGVAPRWSVPPAWTFLAGGCLGTVYVTASVLLTPKIGAAAVMGLSVAGQLLAGMAVDRIGFMGIAVREISLGRVAGAVLLVAGVLLIRVF